MIDSLRRVCALQTAYSSQNTPAMAERGRLIRNILPSKMMEFGAELRAALGPYGNELSAEGSDGIGRKTEAPWVRLFATSMSPSARDGFYIVVHFSADGSAVFVTVGCGSTVWANGDLRPISDEELRTRRRWARGIIQEKFGSLTPFDDDISLGAKAPLPRVFEKATSIARRIPAAALEEGEFRRLLILAAERLREIYEAHRLGRHLTSPEVAERALEALARPEREGALGQGFRLSADERRAIERRAMDLARHWLETSGYSVRDTSATSSFDYEARKDGETLKVEVKGTTGSSADAIFMTRNEVDLHRSERGKTAIIIVSGIGIEIQDGRPVGVNGATNVDVGWNIDDWDHVPLAYRLTRRTR